MEMGLIMERMLIVGKELTFTFSDEKELAILFAEKQHAYNFACFLLRNNFIATLIDINAFDSGEERSDSFVVRDNVLEIMYQQGSIISFTFNSAANAYRAANKIEQLGMLFINNAFCSKTKNPTFRMIAQGVVTG